MPSWVWPRSAISSPPAPTSMIAISAVFTMRVIRALSFASASCPASAENRMKGRIDSPVASALKLCSTRASLKMR